MTAPLTARLPITCPDQRGLVAAVAGWVSHHRVSHRDDVEDLVRKGRDLETVVPARAVRAHLEDRVLVSGGKTVVFTQAPARRHEPSASLRHEPSADRWSRVITASRPHRRARPAGRRAPPGRGRS